MRAGLRELDRGERDGDGDPTRIYAARTGHTPFNVGAAIRPPRPDDRLAERVLE